MTDICNVNDNVETLRHNFKKGAIISTVDLIRLGLILSTLSSTSPTADAYRDMLTQFTRNDLTDLLRPVMENYDLLADPDNESLLIALAALYRNDIHQRLPFFVPPEDVWLGAIDFPSFIPFLTYSVILRPNELETSLSFLQHEAGARIRAFLDKEEQKQQEVSSTRDWRNYLLKDVHDETLQDYYSQLLQPATSVMDVNDRHTLINASSHKVTTDRPMIKKIDHEEALQQRIDQIRQVLPELGEGFVEIALSYFRGDVDACLATLVGGVAVFPPTLQLLDLALPRRKKRDDIKSQMEEERQAKALTKQTVQLQEQEQERAFAAYERVYLDEYNDDYDDQYDDVEVNIRNDAVMYDMEDVKVYNRIVRNEETEINFWEENRNTNRPQGQPHKEFGPDKIKGGRLPKPESPQPTSKAGQRRKARIMENRRAKQKNAVAKKGG